MAEVLEAHQAYKQADDEALLLRARARARLGRAVELEYSKGTPLETIARRLERTREQVRRYRQAYLHWSRDYPGVPLD